MCTVLLRFRPGAPWPLLMAAVRDEFVDRPWEPPAAHWSRASVLGGRDRTAGGTWLAVDTGASPAVAAVLNGVRLPAPSEGASPAGASPDGPVRPTRGGLPLAALDGELPAFFDGYDGFHLVLGTPRRLYVVSWDGARGVSRELPPGDHIVVNEGAFATGNAAAAQDPLVPFIAPLLAALPDPPPALAGTTEQAWGPWPEFLLGGGLPPDDPRALLIDVEHDGHRYGSGSLALVGIAPDAVRYDFGALARRTAGSGSQAAFTTAWSPVYPR